MSIPLVVNGITFNYPTNGEVGWGTQATGWANAMTNGTLQKTGGLFALTGDVDFGPSGGLKAVFFSSRTTPAATTGVFRLANNEFIGWRNAANTGNATIGLDNIDNYRISTAATPNAAVIQANGNMGIGTVSPSQKLSVAGHIQVADGNGYGWGAFTSYLIGSSAGNSVSVVTNNTERLKIDSAGYVYVNGMQTLGITGNYKHQVMGAYLSYSGLGVNTGGFRALDSLTTSAIGMYATEGTAAGGRIDADAGPIAFWAGGSEKMRIDSAGNVGIGTSLTSGGTGNGVVNGRLILRGEPNTTAFFIPSGTEYAGFKIKTGPANASGGADYYDFTVRPGFSGVSANADKVAIRIESSVQTDPNIILQPTSGNVGIGRAPTARLDVAAPADARLVLDGTSSDTNAGGAVLFYRTGAYQGRIGIEANALGNSSTNFLLHSQTATVFFTGNGVNTERMRITETGQVQVGAIGGAAAGTGAHLTVSAAVPPITMWNSNRGFTDFWNLGPGGDNSFIITNQNGTGVGMVSGGTTWIAQSDERLKTDLKPITNALDKVSTLRSVTGRFKTDEVEKSRVFLIAQDVLKVLPEAVDTTDPEKLMLGYTDVIPLLVAAIKELNEKVAALESA